ncbi:hypothetical protein DENSPDRAFT_887379 [Dentipellis sp. KUC8613]|nr:hypothetical protein DENSPDRAFT_887379 [Dentipellis sp. KUC8613]
MLYCNSSQLVDYWDHCGSHRHLRHPLAPTVSLVRTLSCPTAGLVALSCPPTPSRALGGRHSRPLVPTTSLAALSSARALSCPGLPSLTSSSLVYVLSCPGPPSSARPCALEPPSLAPSNPVRLLIPTAGLPAPYTTLSEPSMRHPRPLRRLLMPYAPSKCCTCHLRPLRAVPALSAALSALSASLPALSATVRRLSVLYAPSVALSAPSTPLMRPPHAVRALLGSFILFLHPPPPSPRPPRALRTLHVLSSHLTRPSRPGVALSRCSHPPSYPSRPSPLPPFAPLAPLRLAIVALVSCLLRLCRALALFACSSIAYVAAPSHPRVLTLLAPSRSRFAPSCAHVAPLAPVSCRVAPFAPMSRLSCRYRAFPLSAPSRRCHPVITPVSHLPISRPVMPFTPYSHCRRPFVAPFSCLHALLAPSCHHASVVL